MATSRQKPLRVFSGIKPSGTIHIGNYLGALKQWIPLQTKHECFFSIVDLHAITVHYHPVEMPGLILSAALDYLACGLNPKQATIFVQSHIPEHTELAWLLNTITPIGELERMTQYKDSSNQARSINAGLLNYPVLMAADILLYKTNIVPVGEDQQQHVELTRFIARKFNQQFGDYFIEPKSQLTEAKRVMSFMDPTKKMAKSLGPKHYIALTDSPEVIREKVSKAVTDTGVSSDGKMSPAIQNLFLLLGEFAPKQVKKFINAYQAKTIRYVELKDALANGIIETLKPIQQKRSDLAKRPKAVWKILDEGAKKARPIAKRTLKEVKEKMGLI